MSAFHPGTIEALLYEVAIHQRFKEAAEAVADMYDCSEQIARHTAVIADVTELIRLVEQGNADEAEQDRQIAEADAGEIAVVSVELVPAPALDGDQPLPARGHVHDDECFASDASPDFEFYPTSAEAFAAGHDRTGVYAEPGQERTR